MFYKNIDPKNFAKFKENTFVKISFLEHLFAEHLQTIASELYKYWLLLFQKKCVNMLSLYINILYFVMVSNIHFYTVEPNRQAK